MHTPLTVHSISYDYLYKTYTLILNENKRTEGNYPSNADKSPVERLSLNRSQCGGYSTKYNTLTET